MTPLCAPVRYTKKAERPCGHPASDNARRHALHLPPTLPPTHTKQITQLRTFFVYMFLQLLLSKITTSHSRSRGVGEKGASREWSYMLHATPSRGVHTISVCQLTSAGPSGLIHRPGSKDEAASKPQRPRRKLARDYHRALSMDESGITNDPIAAIKLNVAGEPANSCGNRAKDLSVSH